MLSKSILVSSGFWIADVILTAFAVTMMAAFWSGVIFKSYAQMGVDED